MNAPASIDPKPSAYAHILEEIAERFAERDAIRESMHRRVWAIVDRFLPPPANKNGFLDPDGFMASAIRRGDRRRMAYIVEALLEAKRDGTVPHIAIGDRSFASGIKIGAAEDIAEDPRKAWHDVLDYSRRVRAGQTKPPVEFVKIGPTQRVAV